ncbi:MAG: polyprenyl synthetase family protein [Chitinophagales bacterium]|nr:polyprenyl synthetase family protein [Chitinophagales bacterium]
MNFEQINELIQEDLNSLNTMMKSELKSEIPLLNLITDYLLKMKGKQIRPILVFLSAKIQAPTNHSTILSAVMIELLHTATLVHDDVVDEAETRRGFLSINAKWKNKAAVLLGDYMLSRGLLLALDNGEYNLLQIISSAVKEMSEGELLQIEKAMKLDITEDVYYNIISKKTASLIKTACLVGSHSVSTDNEKNRLLGEIGYNIGMAFQIKDDLLDLGKDEIGKPLAIDIKDQKMTLPLIHTLQKSSWWIKTKLMTAIRFKRKNPDTIQKIISTIENNGGLIYAEKRMNEYADKAKELLLNFDDNIYRKAFEALIDFTVQRRK